MTTEQPLAPPLFSSGSRNCSGDSNNSPHQFKRNSGWEDLKRLMEEEVCFDESNNNDSSDDELMMDNLATRAKEILLRDVEDAPVKNSSHATTTSAATSDRMNSACYKSLEDCFNLCDKKMTAQDKDMEFQLLEQFVLSEQNAGRNRRTQARILERDDEKRLAAEIATLKGFRFQTKLMNAREELQRKIGDAERSYANRKMVVAKAAQTASAECRLQFSRVRDFFEKLHNVRQDQLRRQYRRSLKIQELTHRIKGTDSRVVAMEKQIANRLYHKKKTDLSELHLAQNVEEAWYLESMLELLDQVQAGKETAARELFELQMTHFREQQDASARRSQELSDMNAAATEEITKLISHYTDEEIDNQEALNKTEENVGSAERSKQHRSGHAVTSISELYDTVLWSVATSQLGLSSSGNSMYSSEFSCDDILEEQNLFDDNEDGNDQTEQQNGNINNNEESDAYYRIFNDTGSVNSSTYDGSTNGTKSYNEMGRVSSMGKMHVKRRMRELRAYENAVLKRHEEDAKREKKEYRLAVRQLKQKHQNIVEGLVGKSVLGRLRLREEIESRLNKLAKNQEETTNHLKKRIEKDIQVMKEALKAEDRRVNTAEKESFLKAQTLISAQVFHEVRNALSSVISMSEMTSSLKEDETVSPSELVQSVDEMLDQIKEVVNYSLQILNNVLDISKINTGQFNCKKTPFDLQDLMDRATKMQIARAHHVKMRFVPGPEPCIVSSDSDIIMRIIVNFISNAVKFTSHGSVQPFIMPEDKLLAILPAGAESSDVTPSTQCDHASIKTSSTRHSSSFFSDGGSSLGLSDKRVTMVAVGVADTGPGLSQQQLLEAKEGLTNTENRHTHSGAKNSGFGLHLAHLLASSIGTKLHLVRPDECRELLNDDMISAIDERRRALGKLERAHSSMPEVSTSSSSSLSGGSLQDQNDDEEWDKWVDNPASLTKRLDIPGPGSVLYMTLPVYEDGYAAMKALRNKANKQTSETTSTTEPTEENESVAKYVFHPQPSPASSNGSFRILVADDVLMLRKGLVHTMTSLFPDCPVSISTACSAEDILRAVASQPFDMIISDHTFDQDSTQLKPLSKEEESTHTRPRLVYNSRNGSLKDKHKSITTYFKNERFTIEPGDGNMTGLEVLMKIARAKELPFPTPVLMLLSGHKFDVSPDLGIIVAQKPLKKADFVPLLESQVPSLLKAKRCFEAKNDDKDSMGKVINSHGSQLFARCRRSDNS